MRIFLFNVRHYTALSIFRFVPRFMFHLYFFLFYSILLISLGVWFFDVPFAVRCQAVNIGFITESNLRSRFIQDWQSISIAEKQTSMPDVSRFCFFFFFNKESFLFRTWCFIHFLSYLLLYLYYYSLNVNIFNIFKNNIFKQTRCGNFSIAKR